MWFFSITTFPAFLLSRTGGEVQHHPNGHQCRFRIGFDGRCKKLHSYFSFTFMFAHLDDHITECTVTSLNRELSSVTWSFSTWWRRANSIGRGSLKDPGTKGNTRVQMRRSVFLRTYHTTYFHSFVGDDLEWWGFLFGGAVVKLFQRQFIWTWLQLSDIYLTFSFVNHLLFLL